MAEPDGIDFPLPPWVEARDEGIRAVIEGSPPGRLFLLLGITLATLALLGTTGAAVALGGMMGAVLTLRGSRVEVRGGQLVVEQTLMGRVVSRTLLDVGDVVGSAPSSLHLRDGRRIPLPHFGRDAGEVMVVADYVARAGKARREGHPAPRPAPWRAPRPARPPSQVEVPPWVMGTLHGGRVIIRDPSQDAPVFLALGLVGVTTMVTLAGALFLWWMSPRYAWMAAVMAMAVAGGVVAVPAMFTLRAELSFDPEHIQLAHQFLGRNFLPQRIRMVDVLRVRAADHYLQIYLESGMRTVPMHRDPEQVAALAAHLDHLAARARGPEPEPPEALTDMMRRQRAARGRVTE